MGEIGADFLGSGFGQQLFNFRSPAVHRIARTSSLNCLSCRNPYQTPHSLNPSPLFTENPFLFTEKCFVGSPAQNSALMKFRGSRALCFSQKKRDVHKISTRNSGAGNGCANFMGAWHFWFFLLENPHAHKSRVEVPILVLWAWGFFRFSAFGLTPEYCGKKAPRATSLGAQKASSKYCQTSTAKQREL